MQTHSRHFYEQDAAVQHTDGRVGVVECASALYALIRWADGLLEEVEQLHPQVSVYGRAHAA